MKRLIIGAVREVKTQGKSLSRILERETEQYKELTAYLTETLECLPQQALVEKILTY